MANRICPHCKKRDVDHRATACPYCTKNIDPVPFWKTTGGAALIFLGGLFALGFIFNMFSKDTSRMPAPSPPIANPQIKQPSKAETAAAEKNLKKLRGQIIQEKKDLKQGKKNCLNKFKEAKKAMVDVRDNYAEWYVIPDVWRALTYPQKEDFLAGLSRCREIIVGKESVVIKDGKSGETLGKASGWGQEINK